LPPEIQAYIISLAELQLAFEEKREREIVNAETRKYEQWLFRPKPPKFRELDTSIYFRQYNSFDRVAGIGCRPKIQESH